MARGRPPPIVLAWRSQSRGSYRVSSAGTDLAEPDADCENDTTANDNLDDRISQLTAHETIANESDRDEITYHHRVSELQRDTEIWNQERKCMKHAAKAGRDTGDRAATQRTTTSSDASIIRQRFGKPHARGGTERRREPNKEALRGRPVRPAVAKIGANVETEPSINPRRPG